MDAELTHCQPHALPQLAAAATAGDGCTCRSSSSLAGRAAANSETSRWVLTHVLQCMHCGQVTHIPAMLQVRLLLLAALAGEHVLYVGPPGTAKSELGRRLTRLCKGTFFERLLTRFSVPEVSQALLVSQLQYGLATGIVSCWFFKPGLSHAPWVTPASG